VAGAQPREARDVLVVEGGTLSAQLRQSAVHVERRPEHEHVDDQAQSAELILDPLTVGLAELPLPAIGDSPGELLASLVARSPCGHGRAVAAPEAACCSVGSTPS
jgi:hypothetical protein